jgi:hypothetical protein
MAIQSQLYVADVDVRTYTATKHIAAKSRTSVWIKNNLDVWRQINGSDYDTINNTIVIDEDIITVDDATIEVRVADNEDELSTSQSDITIVSEAITEVSFVANNIGSVNTVSTNIASVINAEANANSAATSAAEASGYATDCSNQVALATTQANNANTSANTATTQAGIATTKASEASTSATNALASANSASASATTAQGYAESIDPQRITDNENNIATLQTDLGNVVQTPISVSAVVAGSYSLSNTLKTLVFDAITYTGNGTSQTITTGVSTIDLTDKAQCISNLVPYYHDRVAGDCIMKGTGVAGTVEDQVYESGSIAFKDIDGVDGLCQVHIKARSSAYSNIVFDGVRGIEKYILTNQTTAEGTSSSMLTSFNSNGYVYGSDANGNANGTTYISYITLYTHIKWGLTNQGKRYIEAYNPVTNDTMIMYQGSGVAGHQIPHSVGVELDFLNVKSLSSALQWISQRKPSYFLGLNTTGSEILSALVASAFNSSNIVLGTGGGLNGSGNTYILYGKAKSKTWTIVPYTGTGSAGNFIETKDSDGIARRPARVIVKAVSSTGSWLMFDNDRGFNKRLYIDRSEAETNPTTNSLTVYDNGFSTDSTGNEYNASGVQYIALVEFDTDSTGSSGAYFDNPTNNTYARLDNGVISYSNGYDNASVNSRETFTGNLLPNNGWED